MRWAFAAACLGAVGMAGFAQDPGSRDGCASTSPVAGLSDGYDPDRDAIEMWRRLAGADGCDDDFSGYVVVTSPRRSVYDIYDDGYLYLVEQTYIRGPAYSIYYGYPLYYWPSDAPLWVSSLVWGPAWSSVWPHCGRLYDDFDRYCGVPCDSFGGTRFSARFGGSGYFGRVYYGTAYSMPPCGPRPTLYEIPRRDVQRDGERRRDRVRDATTGPPRTRDGWVSTPALRQRRGTEFLQPTRLTRDRDQPVQAGRPAQAEPRRSSNAVGGGRAGSPPQPPVSTREWRGFGGRSSRGSDARAGASSSPRTLDSIRGASPRNFGANVRSPGGAAPSSPSGSRPGMGNVRRP